MEKEIFWDVFRDTGDPICWLLARAEDAERAKEKNVPEQGEDKSSAPE